MTGFIDGVVVDFRGELTARKRCCFASSKRSGRVPRSSYLLLTRYTGRNFNAESVCLVDLSMKRSCGPAMNSSMPTGRYSTNAKMRPPSHRKNMGGG